VLNWVKGHDILAMRVFEEPWLLRC